MSDSELKSQANEQRDIHGEANVIKQKLTNVDVPSKYKMSGISEIVCDGLNSLKLRRSEITRYVCDFYFIGEIVNRIYAAFRNDSALKKSGDFDPYGLMLYVFYSVFFVMLKTFNNNNGSNFRLREIQTIFENSGFKNARLPMVFNKYCDGIGRYMDPNFGRLFDLMIPNPDENGLYFENYFLTAPLAHLFPNFRLIISKAIWMSTIPIEGVPMNQRTNQNFRNGNIGNAVQWLNGIAMARNNERKIPGMAFMRLRHVSVELGEYCLETVNRVFGNEMLRYLCLNPNLLRYLHEHYTPLMLEMESFSIANVSDIGTDLILCVMIEDDEQGVIDGEEQEIVPGQGQQPPQIIPALFDHRGTVQTKLKVTNGNAMIASVTPIVRISGEQNRVVLNNDVPQELNNNWLFRDMEYATQHITIDEKSEAKRS